jgi:hypothetical protein
MLVEIFLAGGDDWERKISGGAGLHHIAGLDLPFTLDLRGDKSVNIIAAST